MGALSVEHGEMQFTVHFHFAVYYNKTEARHVLPTLFAALLNFLLVGLVSQNGQVMGQFSFIYKACNNTFIAIRFQVVRRHASKRDGSFHTQLKPRECYFSNFNQM
jgi:hypothetical protein